jgi:hypothetical protein
MKARKDLRTVGRSRKGYAVKPLGAALADSQWIRGKRRRRTKKTEPALSTDLTPRLKGGNA